jgi:hypothetical protein
MKRKPSHRFDTIRTSVDTKERPSGKLETELYNLLQGNAASDVVTRAHDIHAHTYKREVMESFLLVGIPAEEVDRILGIPVEVTEAYKHLFFDSEVFEDELDRIEYAYSYTRNDYGAELKKFAVDLGKESLKIRMSRGSYTVSSATVQGEIRATAYMIAQRAKTCNLTSEEAKEARNWAQLALKASSEEEEKELAGIEEISMELEAKDETTNEEKSGVKPEDITH